MSETSIAVVVSIEPELRAMAEQNDATITSAVGSCLETCLRELGLPGAPQVEWRVSGEERAPLLALVVNEHRCMTPERGLQLAYHEARREHPHHDTAADVVRAWLVNDVDESSLRQFVSSWCSRVIDVQPAVLVSPEHAATYERTLHSRASAETADVGLTSDDLLQLLTRLASVRISVHDVDALIGVIEESPDAGELAVFERAVRTLRPRALELCCEPSLLPRITIAFDEGDDLLAFLREGLFTELGIDLPDFTFVADDQLPAECFRFRLNHLLTPATRIVAPGTILVNDTAERLRPVVMADEVVNPATGQAAAVAPASAKGKLDDGGWTTWDEIGFFILVLAAAIREHRECFVHADSTDELLEAVRAASNVLVEAVSEPCSTETLTSILRSLVEGGISIQNLPPILERLVELDAHDDRSDPVVAIRQSLARANTSRVSRGTNTVVCYLLTPEMEDDLVRASNAWDAGVPPDDAAVHDFVQAYAEELNFLPPTAQRPVILTSDRARSAVATAIRYAFPRTIVVSHGDLDPRANVQPVARIQLEA